MCQSPDVETELERQGATTRREWLPWVIELECARPPPVSLCNRIIISISLALAPVKGNLTNEMLCRVVLFADATLWQVIAQCGVDTRTKH